MKPVSCIGSMPGWQNRASIFNRNTNSFSAHLGMQPVFITHRGSFHPVRRHFPGIILSSYRLYRIISCAINRFVDKFIIPAVSYNSMIHWAGACINRGVTRAGISRHIIKMIIFKVITFIY